MDLLTLLRPFDAHVHLRANEMMARVIAWSAAVFDGAIVMPNTRPTPITDAILAIGYGEDLRAAAKNAGYPDFKPHITIQITDRTTPAMIRAAKYAGVIAGKVYPLGATTNSDNGVTDFEALHEVWAEMAEVGMVACFHGEKPTGYPIHREKRFLPTIIRIAERHPKLKIVLEHITTWQSVQLVKSMPENVGATITVHHLCLVLDDVIGGKIKPHHHCLPTAKRNRHRKALLKAALSGNPKFFLGTDSAPHLRTDKECAEGCAGIFSAPVALPVLAAIFEEQGALDKLEDFASVFGPGFYGLPVATSRITLRREAWQVPAEIEDIVPFKAGETLSWQVNL